MALTRAASSGGVPTIYKDGQTGSESLEVVIGGAPRDFQVSDSFKRPANTTGYTALDHIGSDWPVTAGQYNGTTVTLTVAGHDIEVGDRVTVSGVDTGYTWANVDGDWEVTAVSTDTVSFVVDTQPTGTTPQTVTAGYVRKHLVFDVAREDGAGVLILRATVCAEGVAMTGAMRLLLFDTQQTLLADNAAYTLLAANAAHLLAKIDITPAAEGSGSDATFGELDSTIFVVPASDNTRLYGVLIAEGGSTPVSGATITVTLAGVQN